MAVQKSKKSRSKKGMKNSHKKIRIPHLSIDKSTGEIHLRHFLTKSGFYRGKKCFYKK